MNVHSILTEEEHDDERTHNDLLQRQLLHGIQESFIPIHDDHDELLELERDGDAPLDDDDDEEEEEELDLHEDEEEEDVQVGGDDFNSYFHHDYSIPVSDSPLNTTTTTANNNLPPPPSLPPIPIKPPPLPPPPPPATPWDARLLEVETLEELINRKDEILKLLILQAGDDLSLQTYSEQLINHVLIGKNSSWQKLLKNCFVNFSEHCLKLGVPVFPISCAKVGLYLARFALEDEYSTPGLGGTNGGSYGSLGGGGGGGDLFSIQVGGEEDDEDDEDGVGQAEEEAAALAVAASVDLSVGLGTSSAFRLHPSSDLHISLDPALSHLTSSTSNLTSNSSPTGFSPLAPSILTRATVASGSKVSHIPAGPKPKKILKRKTIEQYLNRLTALRNPTVPLWNPRVCISETTSSGLGTSALLKDIIMKADGESSTLVKKKNRAVKREGTIPKPRGRKKRVYEEGEEPPVKKPRKSRAKVKGKVKEGDGVNSTTSTNGQLQLQPNSFVISAPNHSITISSSTSASQFPTINPETGQEVYELDEQLFKMALMYVRTLKGLVTDNGNVVVDTGSATGLTDDLMTGVVNVDVGASGNGSGGRGFEGLKDVSVGGGTESTSQLGLERVEEIARSVEELQRNGKEGDLNIDPTL